jgi:hypothetical protein
MSDRPPWHLDVEAAKRECQITFTKWEAQIQCLQQLVKDSDTFTPEAPRVSFAGSVPEMKRWGLKTNERSAWPSPFCGISARVRAHRALATVEPSKDIPEGWRSFLIVQPGCTSPNTYQVERGSVAICSASSKVWEQRLRVPMSENIMNLSEHFNAHREKKETAPP